MEIAKRDIYLEQIKKEIKHKKNLLKQEYKILKKEIRVNPMLKSVLNNFQTYDESIINEKEKQLEALDNIYNYLEELFEDTSLTFDKLNEIKQDQKTIFKKIKLLTKELE